MTNTHRWILGSAIVLIVTLGFVSTGLLLRTLEDLRQVRQDLAAEQTGRTTVTQNPLDIQETQSSLARFGGLIPSAQRATHFVELNENLAVIGVEPATTDPESQRDLVLYVADTRSNKLTALATRDLSGPGQTVNFKSFDYGPTVQIQTFTQWEGFDRQITDYVRKADGALVLTETYHNGQLLELTRGDKTLELQLSPKDGCSDNIMDPAKQVNVTGLLANGREIKFKKPYQVTCSPSEMMGAGFYPGISVSYYTGEKTAQGEDLLYVRLPFGVEVRVDVDQLTPESITVTELAFQ
jgi:hypothetical protein